VKKPEWHSVLEPRQAIYAGLVGAAAVWLLSYYAKHTGYVSYWGYSDFEWKNISTAMVVLGFAVPYWLVKWLAKRQ
jgi:hypothetical protein